MTEPPRLLDSSADDLERQLLRAGSVYAASPELREKTLAALGLTGVAAAALGVSAGAALSVPPAKAGLGSLLAQLGAAKIAVVALGVGAAVVAPLAITSSAPEPSQAPRAIVTPPERLRAPAEVLVAPAPRALPPAQALPAATPPARAAATGVVSKPSAAEALRVELAQLEAARSKLKSGRSEEALALLEAYERSAPRGALRLEAEVLRIDALSRSGRTELAKSRASAFLERHPRSVLAARVRRLAGL